MTIDELKKQYERLIKMNPGLDYDKNKNATNIVEIKKHLNTIEQSILNDIISEIIYTFNKEKEEEEIKYRELKKYQIEEYIPLDKMEQIFKYLYYVYEISTDDFMTMCTKVLNVNPTEDFSKYLIDNDIVKLQNNLISLGNKGISLAVSLGISLNDQNKDNYVSEIKEKIKTK